MDPLDVTLPLEIFVPTKAKFETCDLEIALLYPNGTPFLSNSTTFVGGPIQSGLFTDSVVSSSSFKSF